MSLDARSVRQCVRCGSCRAVCPVFEELRWESSSARGRMLVIKRLSQGNSADFDPLDSLNTCTTCAICSESCPAGVSPPQLIQEARRELVSSGVMTAEQARLSQRIYASGNTFGEGLSRLGWLRDPGVLRDRADVVYFAGCLASYRYPEVAAKTFEILRGFGAALLPDERCCSSPLLRTGFDASKLMEANIRQIEDLGAHAVITGCAGCYAAFKSDYSREFEAASVPEFLAEHLFELRLKRLDLTVTYHDPCHLGRRHKIYEQPREVIEAICELQEMKESRSRSRCCGGGGGVRAGYKDLALRLGRRRLKDVPEGVDFIVTSCPMCVRNLNDAGGNGKVIDLVELLSRALPQSKLAKITKLSNRQPSMPNDATMNR